jgi:hypothetical protein
MAAHESLNKTLFHGTAGGLEGGVVKPTEAVHGFGAYATPNMDMAQRFARDQAEKEGRLFGTVYEVSPMGKGVERPYKFGTTEYVDPKGLKANKIVDFPIPGQIDLDTV